MGNGHGGSRVNYLAMLEFENASGRGLTKPTKVENYSTQTPVTEPASNFVGFGAPSSGAFQNSRSEPPTFRHWRVRDPDGRTWELSRHPPATHAEVAESWPPGSVLAPVPDPPTQPDSPPLDGALEARIRAWLDSIGEADPAIIGEVLDLCADDPAILEMYLGLAGDVPDELPSRDVKCCGTCARYRRTSHPHLGHCQAGEPEPAGGLWDSDLRSCDQWEAKP